MVGREKPETPCNQILSEDEWHVLSAWATGKIADTVPSTKQAMHWIGLVLAIPLHCHSPLSLLTTYGNIEFITF
jgi:hypothetical protein